MPIRIYTSAPARQLMDDRPFGIVAWTEHSHVGEAYAIVQMADGTPVLRGSSVSLTPAELEGNVEHAMRVHLGTLWASMSGMGIPEIDVPRFEELLEEIPVEEFALTQIEKASIRGVVAQISLEAQSEELATAFARFHETG